MSLKHEREDLKVSAGIAGLVHNTKVVVPFAVMAWDADATEWYPVFVSNSIAAAVEYVKEMFQGEEEWDIQEKVEIRVGDIFQQIK